MMFERYVRRGARWLDRVAPGWHHRVDPEEIEWGRDILDEVMGEGYVEKRYLQEKGTFDKEITSLVEVVALILAARWMYFYGFCSFRLPMRTEAMLWESEIRSRQFRDEPSGFDQYRL